MGRFSKRELYSLRNAISLLSVVSYLQLPCKQIEGIDRFLCPKCGEFRTGINPKTNLGRCFRCQVNFNTIELVMETEKLNFVDSVKLLQLNFSPNKH